mmetsp:Transcript_10963/g.33607  ORF Transcript_10963/g.33607 Transcript_10963/m.33607 type:complete len:301 (+) Transcript_10963:363-1265(+)
MIAHTTTEFTTNLQTIVLVIGPHHFGCGGIHVHLSLIALLKSTGQNFFLESHTLGKHLSAEPMIGVALGYEGQKTTLHGWIVEECRFFGGPQGELTTRGEIARRDDETQLGQIVASVADVDSRSQQRVHHGHEATTVGREAGAVGAVFGHVTEAVEEVLARDTYLVQPQSAVVNAVRTLLHAHILDVYTGKTAVLFIAQWHHEGMYAVAFAIDDELGEHRGNVAVLCQPADPELLRQIARRAHHKLTSGLVIDRFGEKTLYIGSVSQLSHGETTSQFVRVDQRDQMLVSLCAHCENGSSK